VTRPPKSLHALLSGLVDYAGLFPPARLPMAAAVAEYARHRSSPERWMLGRFVVTAALLDDLADALLALPAATRGLPWAVSALALPPDVPGDARRIAEFNDQAGTLALVDAVETKASSPDEVDAALTELRGLDLAEVYVELPHAVDRAALDALLARVKAGGARAKVRTGGVTADAFPTAEQVATFILACDSADVSFQATAGLHHPLRAEHRLTYEADAPVGTMFGFLNVFVAAAAARAGEDERTLVAILEERDPAAFAFEDHGVTWRERRVVEGDGLALARANFSIAFGSCSFQEPVDDLRGMGLL
jgi:hypothetical protein